MARNVEMTKAEVRAWAARWKMVNEFQREELAKTPPAVKLRQLASLMDLAKRLGWRKTLAEQKTKIWERWQKLRKAYGV